jgi:transcription antitermination factor NusG
MATAAVFSITGSGPPERSAAYLELRWYAAYTRANHEKKAAEQLCRKGVEHFLPLYETVHRWSDRRVRLQLPLFPGYVFVRLALRERVTVLETPTVARLVGFGEQPVALPEQEIETLRKGLSGGLHAQPHPYLTIGRRVRIRSGPLAGMEGILLRRKSNFRVVLSISLIARSVAVEVDVADLTPQPSFPGPVGLGAGTVPPSADRVFDRTKNPNYSGTGPKS